MLVSVTENVASPPLQPTGPTAHTSIITSISLQSALETSMRKVIPDVLNNLSQENSLSMGIDSWGHVKSYHKPGQKSVSIRDPHRMSRTPIAKSVEAKNTIFGSVRLHT